MTLGTGYVAQIGFQMVYFLVLVHMLGPENFGSFASVTAAIMLASPLAGLGYGEVALVRVSQRPQDTGLWAGNAVLATAFLGVVVSVLLTAGYVCFTSQEWLDWRYVLGLALCELVLVRSCGVIARVHQASGKIGLTALNTSVLAGSRAIIAASLYICGVRSLGVLIVALLIGLLPLPIVFFRVLQTQSGPITVSLSRMRQEFRSALAFTSGMASQVIYTDLDKLFLARWTTAAIVGTYSAGYKILYLSFMPIRATLEATVARQYQLGGSDRDECIRFTGKLLLVCTVMASVISGTMYLLAPYASIFLGEDFSASIGVLRLGFALPVIQAVHCILANYLTSIGRQSYRSSVQVATLVVYAIAGFFAIQKYSWVGAIYSTLASEALLGVLYAIGCVYFTMRDSRLEHTKQSKPTWDPVSEPAQ